MTVIGTGVYGGYTAFSAFAFETFCLTENGSGLVAVGNIAAWLSVAALELGMALLWHGDRTPSRFLCRQTANTSLAMIPTFPVEGMDDRPV